MNPFSIRKILVPIDLSHTSLNAIDTAVALSIRHGASLLLLNVIEQGIDHSDEFIFANDHISNSQDVLTALAGTIQYSREVKPQILQEEGNVTEVIIKTAIVHQCDIIVIGTHGASGYRDGFIGSNTYLVIKHSTCPVLTVPPFQKYFVFDKVLFPVRPVSGALLRYDVACHLLSPRSTMNILGLAYGMAERDSNILERVINEIKDDLENDKVNTKAIWGDGLSVAEDVLHYIQQTHPDLLIITSVLDVISKPGFIGPHTQKIINCSKIPVLNIKKIGIPAFS